MGITFGGNAVGGPAGVGDADVGLELAIIGQGRQFADPPGGAEPHQFGLTKHRQSRRIVAAVFKFAQSFQEHRNDVAGGNGGHDATHGVLLSVRLPMVSTIGVKFNFSRGPNVASVTSSFWGGSTRIG